MNISASFVSVKNRIINDELSEIDIELDLLVSFFVLFLFISEIINCDSSRIYCPNQFVP